MITYAEELLAFACVFAVTVLPSLPAGWAFARAQRADWTTAFTFAFAVAAFAAGLVSFLGWIFGQSLLVSAGLYFAILAGVDVAMWVWARPATRVQLDLPALVLVSLTGIVAVLERPWLTPNMDAFYHLAATRSLLFFDAAVVTDPFFGIGSEVADPTSGALHTLLAIVARVTTLDVAFLWGGINVLGAMLVPAAFWVLFRQAKVPKRHALAVSAAVVFLALNADFRFAAYPNRMGLSLLILSLAGIVTVQRGSRGGWPLAVGAGFAAAWSHTGIGAGLIALLGLLALGMAAFELAVRWPDRHIRPLVGSWPVLAATGLASAFALAPRLWYLLRTGSSASVSPDSGATKSVLATYKLFDRPLVFYPQEAFSGGDIMFVLGAALAFICLSAAWRKRDRTLAVLGIVGLAPLLIGFNPLLTPFMLSVSAYSTYRIVAIFWFSPFVALAGGWRTSPVLARVTMVGALLVAAPALHNMFTEEPPVVIRPGIQNVSVSKGWERDVVNIAGRSMLDELRELFGTEWPMIATDEMTGYDLAGLMNVHIYAAPQLHSPAFMEHTESGGRRRGEMVALMAPTTSNATRQQLVRDSGADYVVIWPDRVAENARIDLISDIDNLEVVYRRGDMVVLKVLGR